MKDHHKKTAVGITINLATVSVAIGAILGLTQLGVCSPGVLTHKEAEEMRDEIQADVATVAGKISGHVALEAHPVAGVKIGDIQQDVRELKGDIDNLETKLDRNTDRILRAVRNHTD